MWSIDYVAETHEEETQSPEIGVDPITGSMEESSEVKKDDQTISTQDSEITETEVKSDGEAKTEAIESCEREAAIKRVEELVKQMSLSQETEGNLFLNIHIRNMLLMPRDLFAMKLRDQTWIMIVNTNVSLFSIRDLRDKSRKSHFWWQAIHKGQSSAKQFWFYACYLEIKMLYICLAISLDFAILKLAILRQYNI